MRSGITWIGVQYVEERIAEREPGGKAAGSYKSGRPNSCMADHKETHLWTKRFHAFPLSSDQLLDII